MIQINAPTKWEHCCKKQKLFPAVVYYNSKLALIRLTEYTVT